VRCRAAAAARASQDTGPPRAGFFFGGPPPIRTIPFLLPAPETVNIVVNEDLKTYIDPLTPEEYEALERSILTEGCRDALVLWNDVLVDGHNRFAICRKHGVEFQTVQNARFRSLEDVHLWMIDQHLGRRSVSDFQRGVLALRKKEIVAERETAARAASVRAEVLGEADPAMSPFDGAPAIAAEAPLKSREAVAKAARLSSTQVVMIEKIQKQAAPELVAAVRSGAISINGAAAVADLPVEEQVAAAIGGKDGLKQAAKRARDATRKPRDGGDDPAQETAPELRALNDRVAELTAENEYLRGQVAELQAQLAARAG
jgi:hypothetical protein